MSRHEKIMRAGYLVKVQWESEFDGTGMVRPTLLAHLIVERSTMCTRAAL